MFSIMRLKRSEQNNVNNVYDIDLNDQFSILGVLDIAQKFLVHKISILFVCVGEIPFSFIFNWLLGAVE